MRLQKYLASAGIGSRRKCETYIVENRVKVNGKIVSELGTTVTENDEIVFDNKCVKQQEEFVYYMLYKPIGYITSASDEKDRATVTQLIKDEKHRVFPVGRLDYNTSGLLILTNDGNLTYALTHPKHNVDKTYAVKVKGVVTEKTIKKLEQGVAIEAYITAPAKVKVVSATPATSKLSITIHEGKNRQVRKMCEAVGHDILKLERVALGELTLGKLKVGEYRLLTPTEITYLKKLGGLDV